MVLIQCDITNQSQRKAGSLPVEQFEDRSPIESVQSSARCYPLGLTYKRQTVFSAPNANSKIRNGVIDRNTQMRVELLKVRCILSSARYIANCGRGLLM